MSYRGQRIGKRSSPTFPWSSSSVRGRARHLTVDVCGNSTTNGARSFKNGSDAARCNASARCSFRSGPATFEFRDAPCGVWEGV
jgi:hypothetical protein